MVDFSGIGITMQYRNVFFLSAITKNSKIAICVTSLILSLLFVTTNNAIAVAEDWVGPVTGSAVVPCSDGSEPTNYNLQGTIYGSVSNGSWNGTMNASVSGMNWTQPFAGPFDDGSSTISLQGFTGTFKWHKESLNTDADGNVSAIVSGTVKASRCNSESGVCCYINGTGSATVYKVFVQITGPDAIVVSFPASSSKTIKVDSKVYPLGGTYKWEIITGQDKVQFIGDTNNSSVSIQGIANSQQRGDVQIRLIYTVFGTNFSLKKSITVLQPTFITEYNSNTSYQFMWDKTTPCIWPFCYRTTYKFRVWDHLNPAQPIEVEGMRVDEKVSSFCSNHPEMPGGIDQGPGSTDSNGFVIDDLSYNGGLIILPLVSDLVTKNNQTLKIEGWPVKYGQRCQVYYYDRAISEEGGSVHVIQFPVHQLKILTQETMLRLRLL